MFFFFGDKLLMIRLVVLVVGCSPFGQFGHVLGLCVVCRDFRGNFSSCTVQKFGFRCRNTRGFCVGKNYGPQLDNGWTQGFWLEYELTCSSCFVLILIVACAANQLVVLLCVGARKTERFSICQKINQKRAKRQSHQNGQKRDQIKFEKWMTHQESYHLTHTHACSGRRPNGQCRARRAGTSTPG